MTPVVAHKLGGAGTSARSCGMRQGPPMHQHGSTAQHDLQYLCWIFRDGCGFYLLRAPGAVFSVTARKRARAALYQFPLSQQMEIVQWIGHGSLTTDRFR